MKKKLESELISIAHRILKLTGREDLEKMQSEICVALSKDYILKVFRKQSRWRNANQLGLDSSFFNALEGAFNNHGYRFG